MKNVLLMVDNFPISDRYHSMMIKNATFTHATTFRPYLGPALGILCSNDSFLCLCKHRFIISCFSDRELVVIICIDMPTQTTLCSVEKFDRS